MIERLCYIYGVAGSTLDTASAPPGIDGGKVSLIPGADSFALATSVSAAEASHLAASAMQYKCFQPRR